MDDARFKPMITQKLKEHTWLLWSLIAGVLIAIAITFAVSRNLVTNNSSEAEIAEAPLHERMQELSEVSAFREAYLFANGGENNVLDLQSILASGTFESNGTSVEFRSIKRRPDKSITTLKMPEYDLSFVVNGDLVWQRVRQPNMDPIDVLMEGDEAQAVLELGNFFEPFTYTVVHAPEKIQSIIPNTWKGESCLLVQFEMPISGVPARVYVDPIKMTQIVRIEDFANGLKREVFYSDFRRVEGGMLEPFLIETYLKGDLQNRVVVERFAANPGVISSIFEFRGETNTAEPSGPADSAL